ncbi:MAG: aminotransferase class III-fold pyridoxal phosphate-dependent enzyme [Bifidobacterium aquikefiri]|uniref:4-aminobutyrate aminotransferase n=1 Tax=Bifidobacterium aquikefiri TaxID=1653207 RepID=A0A261G9A3_9BIFI|nr:aminotransferase class III-fold pyridoxal phosphate-dependent enzyme [Bifidobacterium aquikefiri]OZG67999.1 4-aminobutyrate aminotransferase [Bifidobacterium aquikefiri]
MTADTAGMASQAVQGKKQVSNAFDFHKGMASLSDDERALIERRKRILGTMGPLFYDRPVHIVRGQAAHLFDASGNDYLDCYNNVACVGHANPRVREAVNDQLGLQDTHSRYVQDEILDYGERILSYFPTAMDRVNFTNSGSESNDLALRMARVFTGHQGVVVTTNAYHGITSLVSSVSPSFGTGVPLAPFLATVEIADVLTGDLPESQVNDILQQRFACAFQKLHDGGFGVSAVLLDQIFSSDGILPGAPGWVNHIAQAVHRVGGILIADEVQSGFARTGEAFWGFQRHHADADIATIGKPMANGIPTGAVIYKHQIGEAFASCTRYFNTFGGNPVSMRAAEAVLDEIEDRHLLAHAQQIGEQLDAQLHQLLGGTSRFRGMRHAGLFLGIDIGSSDSASSDPQATRAIINRLRDMFILISSSGPDGSTLKLRPPLVFSSADVDRFMQACSTLVDEGYFG